MAKMKYYNGSTWVALDAENADTVGGYTPALLPVSTPQQTALNAKAEYKNGTATFTTGLTHTVTDAFITVNTFVNVIPTGTKVGEWSVESANGSFTITSTASETSCAFEWNAVKAGV